jgi:putative hemin transport protein
METLISNKSLTLREAWRGIQQAKPGLRIREAAKELGTSEAELLATKINEGVVRLNGPWPDLLMSFKTLGRVMSLTRNDTCILEHKGTFQDINILLNSAHAMATVIGPIETRVFLSAWQFAFGVIEEKSDRVLKSIQIFDKSGDAVTKIYLQEKSNGQAYEKIVQDFRAIDQSADLDIQPYGPEEYSVSPDKDAFLADWSDLEDTHDFFQMLKKHKIHRYEAMELVSGKFTREIDATSSPKQILDMASASKLPIMIFAGNRGNLQIHQGKVRTIRVLERGHTGPEQWLNVLDPGFNMHLRMDLVHKAWVVKKPTTDGVVTSVELFDREKNLIAQFFGLRKPGIPELEGWRKLVGDLPSLS